MWCDVHPLRCKQLNWHGTTKNIHPHLTLDLSFKFIFSPWIPLFAHINLRTDTSHSIKYARFLVRILVNPQLNLKWNDKFIAWTTPIHENVICLHLFLIFSDNSHKDPFCTWRLSVSFIRLIPRFLLFWGLVLERSSFARYRNISSWFLLYTSHYTFCAPYIHTDDE